jgi:hypothetical protein
VSDRALVLGLSAAAAPVTALLLWAVGGSAFVVVLVPVAAFLVGLVAASREALPSLRDEAIAFAAGVAVWGATLAGDGAGAVEIAVFVLLMAAACTAAWAWGLWIRGRSVTST